jgi:hypothetical protein
VEDRPARQDSRSEPGNRVSALRARAGRATATNYGDGWRIAIRPAAHTGPRRLRGGPSAVPFARPCGPFAVPSARNSREEPRTADHGPQRFRGYSRVFPAIPRKRTYRGDRRWSPRTRALLPRVCGFVGGLRATAGASATGPSLPASLAPTRSGQTTLLEVGRASATVASRPARWVSDTVTVTPSPSALAATAPWRASEHADPPESTSTSDGVHESIPAP